LVRVATKRALEEKIAAQYFSQQYLGSIHTNVFDLLQGEGHFYDPLQREIEEITMVDLLASLRLRSDFYEAARQIADELLAAAKLRAREFENRAITFREDKAEQKRLQELKDAEDKEMEADRIAKEKAKKDAAEGEDSEHDDW
jgi:Radial spoke protein 3